MDTQGKAFRVSTMATILSRKVPLCVSLKLRGSTRRWRTRLRFAISKVALALHFWTYSQE